MYVHNRKIYMKNLASGPDHVMRDVEACIIQMMKLEREIAGGNGIIIII